MLQRLRKTCEDDNNANGFFSCIVEFDEVYFWRAKRAISIDQRISMLVAALWGSRLLDRVKGVAARTVWKCFGERLTYAAG